MKRKAMAADRALVAAISSSIRREGYTMLRALGTLAVMGSLLCAPAFAQYYSANDCNNYVQKCEDHDSGYDNSSTYGQSANERYESYGSSYDRRQRSDSYGSSGNDTWRGGPKSGYDNSSTYGQSANERYESYGSSYDKRQRSDSYGSSGNDTWRGGPKSNNHGFYKW